MLNSRVKNAVTVVFSICESVFVCEFASNFLSLSLALLPFLLPSAFLRLLFSHLYHFFFGRFNCMRWNSKAFHFSVFSTFVAPFFHFISSLFITLFHFPLFLFAAFCCCCCHWCNFTLSTKVFRICIYTFFYTLTLALCSIPCSLHLLERKHKRGGYCMSRVSTVMVCVLLRIRRVHYSARRKVNDEKCTVVDSGSHYGVWANAKKVNEMFIIIEFILLAETLENTVPDSTVRTYIRASVRSFVHCFFSLSQSP